MLGACGTNSSNTAGNEATGTTEISNETAEDMEDPEDLESEETQYTDDSGSDTENSQVGEYSVTLYDGRKYAVESNPDSPNSYIILGGEPCYSGSTIEAGKSSDSEIYTMDYTIDIENTDLSNFARYTGTAGAYYYMAGSGSEILLFDDGILSRYQIGSLSDAEDKYVIGGVEFQTINEFAEAYGDPYAVMCWNNGMDDSFYGETHSRSYWYVYNFGEYFVSLKANYANNNLSDISVKDVNVMVTSTYGGIDNYFPY
jgi:hypothetical protein